MASRFERRDIQTPNGPQIFYIDPDYSGASQKQIMGDRDSAMRGDRWWDPATVTQINCLSNNPYPNLHTIPLPQALDPTDIRFVNLVDTMLARYDGMRTVPDPLRPGVEMTPKFDSLLDLGTGLFLDGAAVWNNYRPQKMVGTNLSVEAWIRSINTFPEFAALWKEKGVGGFKYMDRLIENGDVFDLILGLRSVIGMDTSEVYSLDDVLTRCSQLQNKGGVLLFNPMTKESEGFWREMWKVTDDQPLYRDLVDIGSITDRLRKVSYAVLDFQPYFHQDQQKHYSHNSSYKNYSFPTHYIVLAEKQ